MSIAVYLEFSVSQASAYVLTLRDVEAALHPPSDRNHLLHESSTASVLPVGPSAWNRHLSQSPKQRSAGRTSLKGVDRFESTYIYVISLNDGAIISYDHLMLHCRIHASYQRIKNLNLLRTIKQLLRNQRLHKQGPA